MQTIEFEARNVYGTTKYYPANKQANILAAIAGTKTLTITVLRHARAMGFTVKQVHQSIAV